MRKFSKGAMMTAIGTGTLITATAIPAHAVDFVQEAVTGLLAKNVYIDSGSSLSNADSISDAYSTAGSGVGIVALPEMATTTFNSTDLAKQILAGTNGQYKTVIVVSDSNSMQFGVASNADAAAISTALHETKKDNPSANTGEVILAAASKVSDLTLKGKSGTVATTEVAPTNTADSSAGGIAVTSIVIPAVAILAFVAYNHKMKKAKKAQSKAFKKEDFNKLPEDLRKAVEIFNKTTQEHLKTETTSTLGPKLLEVTRNLAELFDRISRKGTEQQARMASVQYIDTLNKLNPAIGADYYLDILDHPDLWDDPARRLSEVKQAVDNTAAEIINNIKRVNASKDLEFQVALEALSRSMEDQVAALYAENDSSTPASKSSNSSESADFKAMFGNTETSSTSDTSENKGNY